MSTFTTATYKAHDMLLTEELLTSAYNASAQNTSLIVLTDTDMVLPLNHLAGK